jgi:hypothetical protein
LFIATNLLAATGQRRYAIKRSRSSGEVNDLARIFTALTRMMATKQHTSMPRMILD